MTSHLENLSIVRAEKKNLGNMWKKQQQQQNISIFTAVLSREGY